MIVINRPTGVVPQIGRINSTNKLKILFFLNFWYDDATDFWYDDAVHHFGYYDLLHTAITAK